MKNAYELAETILKSRPDKNRELKDSEISKMFQYAGNRHWLTVVGMILAGISTVLSMLPLGYFSQNASGRLRKIIDDNAGLTEDFLAHQLPDLTGAVVMPVSAHWKCLCTLISVSVPMENSKAKARLPFTVQAPCLPTQAFTFGVHYDLADRCPGTFSDRHWLVCSSIGHYQCVGICTRN